MTQAHKIILCLILLLGIALTYYPHINYQFPLHIDEWYHIYQAEFFAQHGLTSIDAYTRAFSYPDVEQGFHILLAGIYLVFHPSIPQWTYLPSILEIFAILSVFVFVRRLFSEKEGLIAAFLVALIPSNITIGGPVFLIPANLIFIFMPLILLLAFNLVDLRPLKNYALIFVMTTFILYAHPPSAGIIIFALLVYAGLNLLGHAELEKTRAKYLITTVVLSIIASLPNYLPFIQVKSGIASAITFSFFTSLGQVPYIYGLIPTLLFLVGFFIISGDNDKKNLSILITSLFLLVIIVLFANFGVNFLIPYQRVYIALFLIMSIIASKGLYGLLLELNKIKKPIGTAIFIFLIVLTAYFSISSDISTPYYHIINSSQYSNFLWIKANLNNNATAALSPWVAKAFGPVTGIRVYSVIPFRLNATLEQRINSTDAFLASNCTNTTFMKENNMSIVYSESGCENSNLTKVHNDTYVLK